VESVVLDVSRPGPERILSRHGEKLVGDQDVLLLGPEMERPLDDPLDPVERDRLPGDLGGLPAVDLDYGSATEKMEGR